MVVTQRYGTTPAYQIAMATLEAGISALPICPDGTKQPALSGWKRDQEERPTTADVEEWFRHPRRGLTLVTGHVSGGLIALDFDDPATFDAWLRSVQRDWILDALYEFIATGYEEHTPKNGRHLLFRCPEAFTGGRDLGTGNSRFGLCRNRRGTRPWPRRGNRAA